MNFFKLFFGNAKPSSRDGSSSRSTTRDVAYAYWSCLSGTPRCRQQEDVIWIPGMANPAKPRGCNCNLVQVFATESGATETAAYLRQHGGIAKLSEWEASEENPKVIQRRLRAKLDAVIETAHAAGRSEKEDPARAVELYREAIAEFSQIASAGDDWTWRRLPPYYNRLSMVLERLHRPSEALEVIGEFYGMAAPMCPTKADAGSIAKRRDRLSKAGHSAGSSA